MVMIFQKFQNVDVSNCNVLRLLLFHSNINEDLNVDIKKNDKHSI